MRKFRRRLLRQSVDQIDARRAKTVCASRVEHSPRLLHALNPVDGSLHLRVEILDAHGQPVEAARSEHFHVFRTRVAWVELDAELAFGASVEREILIEGFEE